MKQPVEHLVLMGVAGCGKTTAAANLHAALGWPVAEADDFHPQANIDKMSQGVPLTDADRRPWLESLRDWMSEQAASGTKTIVTCSALKRAYRDLLSQADGRVFFIHLVAEQDELRERMEHREGHFMPPSLLPSQFATLEPLADDEDGVTVVSRATPEETFEAILTALEAAAPA
ncbi:MAG: gluconokinase [Actinomyces succiniciruminis]|uniref:Gluconokinase n=1 Tax=Actinomyces succiniciruminis TaxID=1522002 RepID=A0A1L7RRR9_9ACTO|nr:gluconokinase [Actinomyces succiniciruminis]MBE6476069.1 gluconokinase [Actinomyces succiniciruminis]CED92432.1 Gluconate kinase, SKI [Actinomyces succiniciruminis]